MGKTNPVKHYLKRKKAEKEEEEQPLFNEIKLVYNYEKMAENINIYTGIKLSPYSLRNYYNGQTQTIGDPKKIDAVEKEFARVTKNLALLITKMALDSKFISESDLHQLPCMTHESLKKYLLTQASEEE